MYHVRETLAVLHEHTVRRRSRREWEREQETYHQQIRHHLIHQVAPITKLVPCEVADLSLSLTGIFHQDKTHTRDHAMSRHSYSTSTRPVELSSPSYTITYLVLKVRY